jgi:hypothetical protein
MSPRLLLISQEGPALEAYQRLLRTTGASHDVATNLDEARTALQTDPYHALLVDMVTLVRAPQEQKAELHDALSLLPVVRLQFLHDEGRVQATYLGRAGGERVDLGTFVRDQCTEFLPRRFRRFERVDYHLNAVLAGEPLFSPDLAQRTNVLNISENGCFVYTVRDWPDGASVWMQITDLVDDSPVMGTVVRRVVWGTPGMLPGIGIRFTDITPAQMAEIRVLRKSRAT